MRPKPYSRLSWRLLLLALATGLVAVACGYTLPGRGSYPLDIFYEMHYQQSYKSHEPPRLSGVADAVPWYPAPKSTVSGTNTGEYLFTVNCAICHGTEGKGDGPVLVKIVNTYGYELLDSIPPDLTSDKVQRMGVDGTQGFMVSGAVLMPSFKKLLNAEERLLIAEYITTLSPTTPPPPTLPPPATPPPPTIPPTTGALEISVQGDELLFTKERFREVATGTDVVLVFTNRSRLNQHNWVLVPSGKKDSVALRGTGFPGDGWIQPGDPDVIANTKLLSPGETGEIRFTAPPVGTYQFVCTFPGHNSSMFGDFVVTP